MVHIYTLIMFFPIEELIPLRKFNLILLLWWKLNLQVNWFHHNRELLANIYKIRLTTKNKFNIIVLELFRLQKILLKLSKFKLPIYMEFKNLEVIKKEIMNLTTSLIINLINKVYYLIKDDIKLKFILKIFLILHESSFINKFKFKSFVTYLFIFILLLT
jgi:hypothetical protein